MRVSKEVERKAAEAEAEQKLRAEAGRQARQHAERNTNWFQAPTRKFEFDTRVTRAKPRNKNITPVGAKPVPGWLMENDK